VTFYFGRVTKYQNDLRDMVLETAERLEDLGSQEFLKGMA